MSDMKTSIIMTLDQLSKVFSMLKREPFLVESTKELNKCKVTSDEECKWMFRKITKDDENMGKPRIEFWRYIQSNHKDEDYDEGHMIRQCYIDVKE